ncbi:hypothetical protein SAMD00019534_073750 [Acytostelium subglobosum LB1]|uniref:hypothetical protein n=1 Tax=Acytostelium subglobosum LB1 TaxID=1410327 RepID=UPI0006448C9D|nr:hypothetical protein SAMD00019534_073750 [Acytostelium subglobosum LB1]GAM24200.1 hypothetical protein SAMD00019534_073750 [Acytostelium subglobosum LB1]|eukprot:XP_012752526.1 hypothetical protein SAMD00019534_073750 [Acytostelium subglobosum LB1]
MIIKHIISSGVRNRCHGIIVRVNRSDVVAPPLSSFSITSGTLGQQRHHRPSVMFSDCVTHCTNNSYTYRLCTTTTQQQTIVAAKKANNSDHLDSLEDSLVNHDQEEFKRLPKFFWEVIFFAFGALSYSVYSAYNKFREDLIIEDFECILNNIDPLERNEALDRIYGRANNYETIERMFKNGVVQVLVKALDDSDPTVQASAIRTLERFITIGYDVFGEEAVKHNVTSVVLKSMLASGMNSDAATNLWLCLVSIKSNHEYLLNSADFISDLNKLAHSDMKQVVIQTFIFMFANRDNYTLLPKLKPIITYLHKSRNELISNYCEQFLGVLRGTFIPPVGSTASRNKEYIDNSYRFHVSYNAFLIPLTYYYCSYRWSRHTNDVIYRNAKGMAGGIAILLVGTLTSISLYPHYYTSIVNDKIKRDILHQPTIEAATSSLTSTTTTTSTAVTNETPSAFKSTAKKVILSPSSLFVMNQLFPMLNFGIFSYAWKSARYIALPFAMIDVPYFFQSK